MKILWGVTVFGTVAAMSYMVSFNKAAGAPQQAALAGMACAFAVVPYVLARAVEAIVRLRGEGK